MIDFNKPVFRILPEAADAIKNGDCPTCGRKIGDFRNEISKQEFAISGMCQQCQDQCFGED